MAVGKGSILRAAQSVESAKEAKNESNSVNSNNETSDAVMEKENTDTTLEKSSNKRVSVNKSSSKKTSVEVKKENVSEATTQSSVAKQKTNSKKATDKNASKTIGKSKSKFQTEKSLVVELDINVLSGGSIKGDAEMEKIKRNELKKSIEKYGIILPLVVVSSGNNSFEIVDGNKRFAVAKELEMDKLTCIVLDVDSKKTGEIKQEIDKFQYDYNSINNKDNFKRRYSIVSSFGKDMPDYLL